VLAHYHYSSNVAPFWCIILTPKPTSILVWQLVGQSLDNVWLFFSCLKSKHFFLFNYVPRLFLLTCVKFHGKKIDNNNTLTHICLLAKTPNSLD
jgi:hypothetical protein